MDTKIFFENFETIADAPGGIARLRELILDLAVRGKLSQMHGADIPISTLISDLQNELAPYGEMSEIRFDIPDHWSWIPLASVVHHQLGKMLNTSKMKGLERPYLRSVNVRQDGNIDLTDVKRMLIPESELAKYDVRIGDIFVNEGGDVGRNAIWLTETDQEFAFQNQLHRLRPVCGVESRFVQIVLRHAKGSGVIAAMSSGVTIQHFSASALRKLAFPLPPVEEQKRIVAKVDELMALCDQLEAAQQQRNSIRRATRNSAIDSISTASTAEELNVAWMRINQNWTTFADTPDSISSLRSLILDLAVRGKLVAQIESEGDGLDFLSMFPGTARRLEGMKTVPFEIPETWTWSTLGDVSINRDSERIPISKPLRESRQGPYDYYGASGVIDSFDDYLFDKPLLLIGEDGANLVNRSTPIAFIARGKYWVNNHAHVIDSTSEDALEYLSIVINQMDLKPFLTGTAQPKLNQAKLNQLLIPVPPFDEQKRIVSKVAELMKLCDQLVNVLSERDEITMRIAGALSNEVAA